MIWPNKSCIIVYSSVTRFDLLVKKETKWAAWFMCMCEFILCPLSDDLWWVVSNHQLYYEHLHLPIYIGAASRPSLILLIMEILLHCIHIGPERLFGRPMHRLRNCARLVACHCIIMGQRLMVGSLSWSSSSSSCSFLVAVLVVQCWPNFISFPTSPPCRWSGGWVFSRRIPRRSPCNKRVQCFCPACKSRTCCVCVCESLLVLLFVWIGYLLAKVWLM